MSEFIQIDVTSNAQEVLLRVKGFPPRMALAVAKALDEENELTVGYIDAQKLSRRGPTTLGVRSNRLRSSVRASKATVSGAVINSAIGSNVVYAGAHEYGFDGNVTVRSFFRKNHRSDQSSASAEFNPKTGKIRKIKPRLAASGVSHVRSFNRHMRIPERAPIRTGIRERSPRYSAAISAAIVAAWEGKTS